MESVDHEDLLQQLLFLRTRYLKALSVMDPSLLSLKYALAQEVELLQMLAERLTEAVRMLETAYVQRAAATLRETR